MAGIHLRRTRRQAFLSLFHTFYMLGRQHNRENFIRDQITESVSLNKLQEAGQRVKRNSTFCTLIIQQMLLRPSKLHKMLVCDLGEQTLLGFWLPFVTIWDCSFLHMAISSRYLSEKKKILQQIRQSDLPLNTNHLRCECKWPTSQNFT